MTRRRLLVDRADLSGMVLIMDPASVVISGRLHHAALIIIELIGSIYWLHHSQLDQSVSEPIVSVILAMIALRSTDGQPTRLR